MDTMLPSEGGGTGSIPVEDTILLNNSMELFNDVKIYYGACFLF